MTSYIFLALGLLLILIEFYVPGAIMGISGGVLIAISIYQFAVTSQSGLAILLYLISVAILIGCLVKFAIWRIKTAEPERSIYSNTNQEGFIASSFDQTAIGKKGIVLSDLKPGGYILIEGKQHQAISETGYITKGTEIVVVSGQEESLIVKNTKKEELS